MSIDFLSSPIRCTSHSGADDLLSAGLGLAGLAGLPVPFVDPAYPTPEELRRRAIQTSWKGIADLGPLGGYGQLYGLIPAAFTSDAYIAWLRTQDRAPHYWRIPHAQHFDAFLALPGFGDRYVPLLPYGYAALDQMHAHVVAGAPLTNPPAPQAQPRGVGPLGPGHLNLAQ